MKKTRLIAVVLSFCMLLALVPVAALAVDFTDIDDATNGSYANAIERWSDEGVISGVGNDAFNPKGNMTRVQGFGIIANLLNLTEKADLSEYTDVPTATWKADYLAKVVAAGIVTGYPDKTLRPDDELTREQMFVTIAKTLGIQPVETDDEAFEDIGEAASYAAPYINALHKMGAVNGSNGKVNPLATLSREGAALLLDNLIGGYANADGETATIVAGKITLIVADNAKVEGTANELPIVIAGQAHIVDMSGVKGAATVNVTVPGVEIRNAPVGTKVTVPEGVTGVKVNGRAVAGGQTITVEGTSGGGSYIPPDYNYTITYYDDEGKELKKDVSSKSTEVVKTFTVLTANKVGLIVDTGHKFASWKTEDGSATYAEGALYEISGNLYLYPQLIDTNDYIAMAVQATMENINELEVTQKLTGGITVDGSSVKLSPLAYSEKIENGTRPQTVSGSVSATTDLADTIIEQACNIAIQLLTEPGQDPSEDSIRDIVTEAVHDLEQALGIEIYREDSVRTIAKKIYEGVKKQTSPIFTTAFKNYPGNTYCIDHMNVAVGTASASVSFTTGQATLDLGGKTRREIVSGVAFAIAKDLYADLEEKVADEFTENPTLSAKVTVKFTAKSSSYDYPDEYPVTVNLTLDTDGMAEVKYDSNLDAVDGQTGAVIVKVNANTIADTYEREVKEVINAAIKKMEGSLDSTLGSLAENGGELSSLASAVESLGVAADGEEEVKELLNDWLTANLAKGLDSDLIVTETPDNSAIIDLVVDLSDKASNKVIEMLDAAKEDVIEGLLKDIPASGLLEPEEIEELYNGSMRALFGDKFVPYVAEEDYQPGPGNAFGIEQLGSNLGDESIDTELESLKTLEDGIKIYIYSVITDALKEKFQVTAHNYTDQNYEAMVTAVNDMIDEQLEGKGIYDLFDTLNTVSTLNGLAGLTLEEIKNDFVDNEEIRDVVSGLGLSESLKGYIDKIPTDRLPDEATVTFHIGNGYTLSKEDLASFKNVATRDGLAEALADLAGKGPKLKLSDFDFEDTGVQVDVRYNSRAFTFYLWIDGLK